VEADERGVTLRLSRATARRHLSSLADDGAVDIQLRCGTAGRPEHRYGLPAGTAARPNAKQTSSACSLDPR
jgi:predicted ArsR family transcriptional regulator